MWVLVYYGYKYSINKIQKEAHMQNYRYLQAITYALIIIGALNWGLMSFGFNLVGFLFGDATFITRLIYSLVGISALINTIE